jgi:hypothetical protein
MGHNLRNVLAWPNDLLEMFPVYTLVVLARFSSIFHTAALKILFKWFFIAPTNEIPPVLSPNKVVGITHSWPQYPWA